MRPQKEFWFCAVQLFILCDLLIANDNFHCTDNILYILSCLHPPHAPWCREYTLVFILA